MMMRTISFVLRICIITILFNCSKSTEQTKFAQTVNGVGVHVPTNSLFTIGESENVQSDGNQSRSFHDDNELDHTQKKIINESSQRTGDNIVSSPNHVGYFIENRNENSKSIVKSEKYKRSVEPQDICNTNECKCKHEATFLTVDCHFQQVSVYTLFNWLCMHLFALATSELTVHVFHIEVQCYN